MIRPFFQPITRDSIGQARGSRDLVKQYLGEKSIPHEVSMRQGRGWLPGSENRAIPKTTGPHLIQTTSANPAIQMHEAGHIANAVSLSRALGSPERGIRFLDALGKLSHASSIATVATPLAVDEENPVGQSSHWFALGGAPKVLEEATASGRGLHNLKRIRGRSAAFSEVLPLLFGVGTYAATPAAAAATAKYINNIKNAPVD